MRLLPLAILFSFAFTGTEPLFEARSAYSHIVVTESANGVRHLKFDDITQSSVKLGDPKHLIHDYTQTSMVGLALVEQPKRVLIIGLGGGSMPMFLHAYYPKAVIDVVDVDAAVVDAARKFFEYKDAPPLHTYVADGAKFVQESKDKYDLIFLDAYAPDFIPPQLATTEFFNRVKAHLTDDGAVLSNVWGPPNPAYEPMLKTQRSVFKNVYVVHARRSGNEIFVATAQTVSKEALVQKARAVQKQRELRFDLATIVNEGWR
jgi:spermidine synthase